MLTLNYFTEYISLPRWVVFFVLLALVVNVAGQIARVIRKGR